MCIEIHVFYMLATLVLLLLVACLAVGVWAAVTAYRNAKLRQELWQTLRHKGAL